MELMLRLKQTKLNKRGVSIVKGFRVLIVQKRGTGLWRCMKAAQKDFLNKLSFVDFYSLWFSRIFGKIEAILYKLCQDLGWPTSCSCVDEHRLRFRFDFHDPFSQYIPCLLSLWKTVVFVFCLFYWGEPQRAQQFRVDLAFCHSRHICCFHKRAKEKKCERHQCKAKCANVNSAKESTVQKSPQCEWDEYQVCECQQCDAYSGARKCDSCPNANSSPTKGHHACFSNKNRNLGLSKPLFLQNYNPTPLTVTQLKYRYQTPTLNASKIGSLSLF